MRMADSVAALVLAAGAGTRLRPLTRLRPKALCPVGDRPLVDHALARVGPVTTDVTVNAHHGLDQMRAHLEGRVRLSVEQPEALGTAGALGLLRPWIDGRPVLVTNADAWLPADLRPFVEEWDGERVRLLCVEEPGRGDFGSRRYCGAALMPWPSVSGLRPEPSGLYEVCWAAEWHAGRLDLVVHDGPFVDCGTPADYLAANLAWSGGAPVVGEGAVIGAGAVLERSVVWPGAVVAPGEHLVDAIRADHLTVQVG
jgi:NDP-sugar pyrophosphorylase family protein